MSITKYLSGKTIAGVALGMMCAGVMAAPDLTRDIQFAKQLNEIGLTDYADLHVNNLLKQYPGNESLRAQLVDNLLAQKKVDEAIAAAKALNDKTDAYFEAAANIGIYATTHRDFDNGIKYLSTVFDFAEKTGKIKQFKNAVQWLMTAYTESGRTDDAQKVRTAIQMADNSNPQSKRDMLYARAAFALESVETSQNKLAKDSKTLAQKLSDRERDLFDNNALKARYEEQAKKLQEKAGMITDQGKLQQLAALLAKKKEEDTKYYQGLIKGANPTTTNKARLDVYKAIGELVDLTADEMTEMANAAANYDDGVRKYRQDKARKELNEVKALCNKLDNEYLVAQRDPKADPTAVNKRRLDAYYKWGAIIGMPESEMRTLSEIKAVQMRQPERKRLIVGGIYKLNDNQKAFMERSVPLDWMDAVYQALRDAEEVQWGGIDVRTATAVVLNMRCRYYLQDYESGLTVLKKYGDLFDLCDKAYREDKELSIEMSPGADAKMWEGMLCEARAQELLKSKKPEDQKLALKYYKRAFVCFGKLLKNYPKHRDGAKNYPRFQEIAKKVEELDPKIGGKLRIEAAKVKKPEMQESVGEIEELVTPLAANEFKTANQMASELMKKDRSRRPATDAEWANCIKHYDNAAKELLPSMADKYRSNGLPKLINHLLISYGYIYNTDMMEVLTDLAMFKFRSDPLVAHGLLVGTNAIWNQADRMAKDVKNKKKVDTARAMKDKAFQFYDLLIQLDPANESAPQVVVRMAREEFLRANDEGIKLNKATTPDDRAKLRKAWIDGFDRSVERYRFVRNNYSNRADLIDESFERSAEAYALTERFLKAAEMDKEFCDYGSKNPAKIVTAKMDAATNLYRQGGVYEKEARAKREEAVTVIIPEMPAETAKPAAPAAANAKPAAPTAANATPAAPAAANAKPAAPTAANATPAAPAAANAAPAAPAVDPAAAAAAEAEARAKLEKEIKLLTEKKQMLNQEADKLEADAKTCYKEAIEHVNELLNSWVVKGGRFADNAKDPSIVKNVMRGYSLLPWLYDGAGDAQNAVKSFEQFTKLYPKDKAIPQYLMRWSTLLTEMDRAEEAGVILNRLSTEYKDTPEGKNAKFSLVRNLYGKANYKLALRELGDIFKSPDAKKNLNVSNYRWIASELANCPSSEFRKDAANYSLLAAEKLLNVLAGKDKEMPLQMTDWVGDLKAKEFAADKKQESEFIKAVTEKLLNDSAGAAMSIDAYDRAIDYYTRLEKLDKNTPYFYQMTFGRANAYLKTGKLEEAKKDLTSAGRKANLSRQTALYNKAQVMIGDIWEKQGDLNKAFAFYMIIAGLPFDETTVLKVNPNTPEDDTPLYLERAVYKAADLASKLNRPADKEAMIKKYQQYYPNGKYKLEIRELELN